MKLFLFLIGMVAAGILGYSFEPDMRQQLTGITPEKKSDKPKRILIPTGAPAKTIDFAGLSADQLPEKITLKADAEVADAAADLKMTIPAGSRVSLVRIEGANAIISPGAGPFEGTVPVSQTDLAELVAAMPANPVPDATAAVPTDPMAETPAASEESVATNDIIDGFGDANTEQPANPEMTEEPADPEPAPAVPEETVPDGPVDVVAVMQASIKGGEIKEFSFDQVLDWEASEAPEKVDGADYQTGIASYKAETVFGVKTIQAKALIKGGKVVKWLWPKSGMEIK